MQRKIIIIVLLSIITISLVSCGQTHKGSGQVKDYTDASRTVSIADKEQLLQSILRIIKGEDEPESFSFSSNDIIENCEVNNYYFFNGAVYIQTDKYMYRFQLDIGNVITSYIKYTLDY